MRKGIDTPMDARFRVTPAEMRRIREDPVAKEAFVIKNNGLVQSLAYKAAYRWKSSGAFDVEDLMQEGRRGLLTAIDRFDVNRGLRFSTYATWWIKQRIRRFIQERGFLLYRYPAYIWDGFVQNQKSADPAELAKAERVQEDIDRQARAARFGPPAFDETRMAFDVPTKDVSPLEVVVGKEEKEIRLRGVHHVLQAKMSPRDAEITVEVLGSDRTLKEIGKDYGLCRERVRQISLKGRKAVRKAFGLSTNGAEKNGRRRRAS